MTHSTRICILAWSHRRHICPAYIHHTMHPTYTRRVASIVCCCLLFHTHRTRAASNSIAPACIASLGRTYSLHLLGRVAGEVSARSRGGGCDLCAVDWLLVLCALCVCVAVSVNPSVMLVCTSKYQGIPCIIKITLPRPLTASVHAHHRYTFGALRNLLPKGLIRSRAASRMPNAERMKLSLCTAVGGNQSVIYTI